MSDPEEMGLEELREEYRDRAGLGHSDPEEHNRKMALWHELRDRVDVEQPPCPECGEGNWGQAPGEPVQCNTCGEYLGEDPELRQEIQDAWNRIMYGDDEEQLVTDGGVNKERFKIEVNDEVTLARKSTVEHADYGPMDVDQISIGPNHKRARLKSPMREDGLSIELTGEEIREQWGDTIATDPFELREEGHASYEKYFSSSDERLQVELSVSGPEDRAEPTMAHLDDQVNRVLEALEERRPPEECEGRYDIDWEAIFEKIHGGANLDDF